MGNSESPTNSKEAEGGPERPLDQAFRRGMDSAGLSRDRESMDATDFEGMVRAGRIPATTWIDMVEIGRGCGGACLSCGAFKEECGEMSALTVDQLEHNITQEIFNITESTRVRLVDLFRKYITTGIDTEPLDAGIFPEAAELIHRLSNGSSRLVCISHGARAFKKVAQPDDQSGAMSREEWDISPIQKKRLKKIGELMKGDIVPLFVLSVDSARSRGLFGENADKLLAELGEAGTGDGSYSAVIEGHGGLIERIGVKQQEKEGLTTPSDRMCEPSNVWQARLRKIGEGLHATVRCKIKEGEPLNPLEQIIKVYIGKQDALRNSVVEMNARSYAATLVELIPALEMGARITISLQGDKNINSLVYQGIAREIWQRTINILQQEHGVRSETIGKLHVEQPRLYVKAGRARKLELDPSFECPVIPDTEFLNTVFEQTKFRSNRGRITARGDLQVQLFRPRRTYNDTIGDSTENPDDPAPPNPWRTVDLSITGREFREELAEPRDFLARMKRCARPRSVKMPGGHLEIPGRGCKLNDVYPFSQLPLDQKYSQLISVIGRYISGLGPNVPIEMSGELPLLPQELRELVIRSLIPAFYIETQRDAKESVGACSQRLAEALIDYHTPNLNPQGISVVEEGEQEKARIMGTILALQTILRVIGIDLELIDDVGYEASSISPSRGSSDLNAKKGAEDGPEKPAMAEAESSSGAGEPEERPVVDIDVDAVVPTRSEAENSSEEVGPDIGKSRPE